jgi:hypothetical protein
MKKLLVTKIAVLAIVIISIYTACGKKNPPPTLPTKDKYGLPLLTQTGANTFGCLIDGVPFVVEGEYDWFTGNGINVGFNLADSIFLFNASINSPRKRLGIIARLATNIIGTHDANKYISPGYSYLSNGESPIPGQEGYFIANDTLESSITITHSDITWSSTISKGSIVSGLFDLTLAKSDGTLMRITEGRFDYKFK